METRSPGLARNRTPTNSSDTDQRLNNNCQPPDQHHTVRLQQPHHPFSAVLMRQLHVHIHQCLNVKCALLPSIKTNNMPSHVPPTEETCALLKISDMSQPAGYHNSQHEITLKFVLLLQLKYLQQKMMDWFCMQTIKLKDFLLILIMK